jgi:hypothetical protein
MTNSGPPSDVKTAEAKAPQPTALPPQTSQGVMTQSKTGTLGSATLLSSAPPAPIPGGGIILTPLPPQAPVVVNIPPLPGEVLSFASFLPPSGGATPTDDPSNFSVASHTQGHRTTPLHDAIMRPLIPRPQRSSINSHQSLIWTLAILTRGHRTIPSLPLFIRLLKVGGSPI